MALKDLELHYRCFAVFGTNGNGAFPTPITLKRRKIQPYCFKVAQSLQFLHAKFRNRPFRGLSKMARLIEVHPITTAKICIRALRNVFWMVEDRCKVVLLANSSLSNFGFLLLLKSVTLNDLERSRTALSLIGNVFFFKNDRFQRELCKSGLIFANIFYAKM